MSSPLPNPDADHTSDEAIEKMGQWARERFKSDLISTAEWKTKSGRFLRADIQKAREKEEEDEAKKKQQA